MMSKEYVSDSAKYMNQFLKDHPEVVEEQQRAVATFCVDVLPASGLFPALPAKGHLIPVKSQEKL